HRNQPDLLETLREGIVDVLFRRKMMLANVVAQHAKHENHESALHRNTVDDLAARLEPAGDFPASGLQLGWLQVLENADEQDGIKIAIRIRHLRDIAVAKAHIQTLCGKAPGNLARVGGKIDSVYFLILLAEIQEGHARAVPHFQNALAADALLQTQFDPAPVEFSKNGPVIVGQRIFSVLEEILFSRQQ